MRRNKVVKKIIVAVAAVAMAFTVIPGGHASPRAGTDLTMDDYDEILCYGISFFKKRCMVKKK